MRHDIRAGKLVTLSGVVGCGKTTTLRRIQETLAPDREILVSKSLSVDKGQLSLPVLINALFYDLATEKDFKIPTQPEKRERVLRDLIRKRGKPIALFIDDAHDLHAKTLVGLKRLIEVVRDGNGVLSVVLAGHPKLKNDLRRPTMEEIGSRAAIFDLEAVGRVEAWPTRILADGDDVCRSDRLGLRSERIFCKMPIWAVSSMQKVLQPTAKRVNISKRIGWHTFRHTYSSLLSEYGNEVKVVQELMRHAKVSTKMEIYTHARMEKKREAHSKVVDVLFGRKRLLA